MDRYKEILREALRPEAERIMADENSERAQANLALLFAGAQIRIDERLQGVELDLAHSSEFYDLGRAIADTIAL